MPFQIIRSVKMMILIICGPCLRQLSIWQRRIHKIIGACSRQPLIRQDHNTLFVGILQWVYSGYVLIIM